MFRAMLTRKGWDMGWKNRHVEENLFRGTNNTTPRTSSPKNCMESEEEDEEEEDLFTYHVSDKAQAFVSEDEEEDEEENDEHESGSPGSKPTKTVSTENQAGKRRLSEVLIEVQDDSPKTVRKRTRDGKETLVVDTERDAVDDRAVTTDWKEDDFEDAFVRELLGSTPSGPTTAKKTNTVHGLTPEYARLRAAVMKRELALKSLSDEDQSGEILEELGMHPKAQIEEGEESSGHRIYVICNYPAGVDRFSIRLKDPVEKLLKAIRQVGEENDWIGKNKAYNLVKNNKLLNLKDSVKDAGLENEDIVELELVAEEEEASVRLVCQCSYGREAFRLRLADKVRCLFDGFAKKAVQHGWCKPTETLKFTWDGDTLTGEERVDSLDAAEDDIVEVFIT